MQKPVRAPMSAFGKLMCTCTTLLFFLSVTSIDAQATALHEQLPFGTPHFSYNNISALAPHVSYIPHRPIVKGYVKIAIESNTTTTPPLATTTPPLATTTPKLLGLDRAIDRVKSNLEDHPNKGLANALEHLLSNRERKMGGDDATTTPTTTPTLLTANGAKFLGDISRIKQLKPRVKQLNLPLSATEQKVIAREKKMVQSINGPMIKRLKGRILLSVENNGEAFYLSPDTGTRFYLQDGTSAFNILRAVGLGVTTDTIKKIPLGRVDGTSAASEDPAGSALQGSDTNLAKRLEGKLLLQVTGNNAHGQAWYILNGKRYYLKDGDTAYLIMRKLSLGITEQNINQIPVETVNLEESGQAVE